MTMAPWRHRLRAGWMKAEIRAKITPARHRVRDSLSMFRRSISWALKALMVRWEASRRSMAIENAPVASCISREARLAVAATRATRQKPTVTTARVIPKRKASMTTMKMAMPTSMVTAPSVGRIPPTIICLTTRVSEVARARRSALLARSHSPIVMAR